MLYKCYKHRLSEDNGHPDSTEKDTGYFIFELIYTFIKLVI
jgi:hypothetical protein